jgi:hypothetical protein
MSALRDFEDEFESLRANLEAAIWRAVGSFDEINDLLKAAEAVHPENVVSVVLDQQSIETLRAVRDDVAETISAAFINLEWAFARAMRSLKQALATEAAP